MAAENVGCPKIINGETILGSLCLMSRAHLPLYSIIDKIYVHLIMPQIISSLKVIIVLMHCKALILGFCICIVAL